MNPFEFIGLFRRAFGERAGLPLAFWYSDSPLAANGKIQGCMFRVFADVLEGASVSLSLDNIGCGGGKLYAGFAPMGEHIPNFVSNKEHYKDSPEAVVGFIRALRIEMAGKRYLNITRVDKLASFDGVEGVVFFATPDVLSGLCSWAFYDNHSSDAVTSAFGSGCSAVFTQAVNENRANGRRCFLGLFDPSARVHFGADILSFAVPMSRFREMCATLPHTCLIEQSPAWDKIRTRING